MMLELDNLNFKTWCTGIRNTLCEYGSDQCWLDQQTSLPSNLVANFKESVFSRYTRWWYEEINNIVLH
jgi:hypothetical protein